MSSIALPSDETTSSLSTHQTADPFPRPTSNKSTGPRSKEGKSRGSQNARKHNLSATTPPPSLLSNPTYPLSHEEFKEEFNRITPAQSILVNQLTFISWKLDHS